MKPVVVIAAVPQEITFLEQALASSVRVAAGGFTAVAGTIGMLPVVVCAGGVGKVNAAAATAVMIERYQPQLVINTGCAGAYMGSGYSVGTLVGAREEVLADDGVIIAEGWKDLSFMKLPSVQLGEVCHHNVLPLSPLALTTAEQLGDRFGIALEWARFASVSTCSGTRRSGAELSERWGAAVESMEGAAVVQVCLRCGVDCLEIRGISNMVDERDLKTWDIPRAVAAAQRFVLHYLEEMDRSNTVAVSALRR
jgi:futalosine hydrolase